jgi:hypothetical protein
MKTQKLVPAILIILLFLACMPVTAQIDKMKDLMDDEMTEQEDGLATNDDTQTALAPIRSSLWLAKNGLFDLG